MFGYRNTIRALLGLAVALCTGIAAAQSTFPTHPVRIIVPFPPGGSADTMMRTIAAHLRTVWGQTVYVDNKPGGGTVIGTDAAAKAPADGHTLGLVITSHVINPSTRKGLPYDTLKDFTAVTQLAVIYLAVLARPDVPVHDVKDLVAYSKQRPGKVTYGTAGAGTSAHLFGEMLNLASGSSLVHIGYKGSMAAQADLLGGHLDLLVDAMSSQMSMVDAGRIRMVALTSPKRHPNFAKFPTVAETVPGVSVESFFGIVVPSATPPEIVQQLNRDLVAALEDPGVRQKIVDVGLVPVGSSSEAFEALIRSDIAKWADVIQKANIKID
ncbi:MAG: Bug family tripartite tricarboxylate transporter substrate binding protein [Lautropia sp.]